MNNRGIFVIEFFLVVLVYAFFYDILYPLRVFMTLIHESMHGLMALATGGGVQNIELKGYEGVTFSYGGIYPLISIFGYVGMAIIGSLLIGSKFRTFFLFLLYSFVTIMLIIYTKFNIESIAAFGFMVVTFGLYLKYEGFREHYSFIFGSFLALQSIEDIRNYLVEIPYKTDSGLLAEHWHMPLLTLPISIFMVFITVLLYSIAVRRFFFEKDI